jgi:hypothetical protein
MNIEQGSVSMRCEMNLKSRIMCVVLGGWLLAMTGCATLDERAKRRDSVRVRRTGDGEVTRLDLRGMIVTRKDIQALGQMKRMRWLAMPAKTTDADAAVVAEMPNLESLSLIRTRITDQTLTILRSLKRLRHLNLMGTKVSDGAVEALQQANRTLTINR